MPDGTGHGAELIPGWMLVHLSPETKRGGL